MDRPWPPLFPRSSSPATGSTIGGQLLLAACLLAASGCAPVKGELDGAPVDVQSVLFTQETRYYDNGDGEVQVWLAGLEDPCSLYEAYYEAEKEAVDAGDLADVWAAYMPEEFWFVRLTLRLEDPRSDQEGTVLQGVDWNESVTDALEVQGDLYHYVDHLDEDFFLGLTDAKPYRDHYASDRGELEVTGHEVDESLAGVFHTTAYDAADGEEEDEIRIRFRADRCRGVEKYLY